MPPTPPRDAAASEASSLLPPKDDDGPSASDALLPTTATLAFALLTQSYLLVGVFPYAGFLAIDLVDGLTEETAGSYAGLIASSFMVGRTLSSFEWGKAADRYGRVFVIKASLITSAAFSVLFGLAPTFSAALLARFLLGACNGLIGPIKTLITELADGDEARETNMMALVMGMWGYGFLVNPAISGYLSDPVKQYPDARWVRALRPALVAHPFLLPNLVGCLFCLVGFVLVHRHVRETLPEERRRSFWGRSMMMRNASSWGLFKHLHCPDGDAVERKKPRGGDVPSWIRPSPSTAALAIVSPRTSVTRTQLDDDRSEDADDNPRARGDDHEPATIKSLMKRKVTRQHLVVYWVYSFLVISVDEIFPLFCISKASGLAIEEKVIGNLLSGTGVCYIFIQYVLLTQLVDRRGFYGAMRLGALLSVPLVCLLPLSLRTNREAAGGRVTWSTLLLTSAVYAVVRAFSSVTFSTVTMTTNRTVPARHRAAMNGLAMLGGSLAKAAGPTFAGALFSASVGRVRPPWGSAVAYGVVATMGLGLFGLTVRLPEHGEEDEEEPPPRGGGSDGRRETEAEERSADDEEDGPPSF